MNYDEAIETTDLTFAEAEEELTKHGCDFDGVNEFLADTNKDETDTFTGREVLSWLGY